MTRLRTAAPDLPARTRRWMLPGLVIALLAGLVWIHTLSGGHHPGAASARQVTLVVAADHCANGGHPSCPIHFPRHSGPVCQSGAVPSAAAVASGAGLGAAMERVGTVPRPVHAPTPAPRFGEGSGCDPPSLTILSISRT